MKLSKESEIGYHAIRSGVAFSEDPDLLCLQIKGDSALDVLDKICPCDIFLQNGQMKHTLLLDDNGIPFADIYVCMEDFNTYILGYCKNADTLIEWINFRANTIEDYAIIDLMKTHFCINLDGPYSWELASEVFGSDILSLPYLSMLETNDFIVFRGGRTGEYGYHFLVPKPQKNSWLEKVKSQGAAYKIKQADKTALSQCALENFFFDLYKEGSYGLSPMELQLQWRLSTQKNEYPGASAIKNIKKTGWNQRMVCFISPEELNPNDKITYEGIEIGQVLSIGYSPIRGDYVGKALLIKPYWHSGLDGFYVNNVPVKTISAPSITNLSLKVSPYRNSYHTRKESI
ncbi:MAG: hypothetical protein OEW75_07995 [Cyclobacteriaceae bacterium]|nr:hypothetical protein [Cyclobacteriaceae bacterium]